MKEWNEMWATIIVPIFFSCGKKLVHFIFSCENLLCDLNLGRNLDIFEGRKKFRYTSL
jgi:hypothetical protein